MANEPSTHDRIPFAQQLILRLFQTTLELIAIHRCPVGKTPFFDAKLFPFADALESASQEIIDEYDSMTRRIQEIPALEDLSPENRFLSNDKCWKTLVLRTYDGTVSPLARELCPKTLEALEAIPNVRVAFFSILEPGKKLPAHRGPFQGLLRCHLGIKIPEAREDCRIRVGKEWRSWQEGKVLIFDDSYEHEVANDTNERRVILFIDFVRPLLPPFDWINRVILTKLLDKAEFVTTFTKRQTEWEQSVRDAWRRADEEKLRASREVLTDRMKESREKESSETLTGPIQPTSSPRGVEGPSPPA